MTLNRKDKTFHLDSFYHQLKTNCSEFGIQRYVIDRYIGQIEDITRKNSWKLNKEDHEDA